MTIYDGSNRDQCEVSRPLTNTPLQALVMMNDPTMLEASRVLAGKLLKQSQDTEKNIQQAFRMIVCRYPNAQEISILKNYHDHSLKSFTDSDAQKLIQVGEYPMTPGLDAKSWAALMQVISTIYNMEETISKT